MFSSRSIMTQNVVSRIGVYSGVPYSSQVMLQNSMICRPFFSVQKYQTTPIRSSGSLLMDYQMANFSLKMRAVRAKLMAKRRVKKYKLKTKKSAQKRIQVVSKSLILIGESFVTDHSQLLFTLDWKFEEQRVQVSLSRTSPLEQEQISFEQKKSKASTCFGLSARPQKDDEDVTLLQEKKVSKDVKILIE